MTGVVIYPGIGTRICIASGVTDPRHAMIGRSALGQDALEDDPFNCHVLAVSDWRGDIFKLRWLSGDGLCLFVQRLGRGRFSWRQATRTSVCITQAQLSLLLEGLDWRYPVRTAIPTYAESSDYRRFRF